MFDCVRVLFTNQEAMLSGNKEGCGFTTKLCVLNTREHSRNKAFSQGCPCFLSSPVHLKAQPRLHQDFTQLDFLRTSPLSPGHVHSSPTSHPKPPPLRSFDDKNFRSWALFTFHFLLLHYFFSRNFLYLYPLD